MKDKDLLEIFNISKQLKSNWKIKKNKRYNIILLLETLEKDKIIKVLERKKKYQDKVIKY